MHSTRFFVINSGETTNLNLKLVPSDPSMGLAIIESTPMGAEIFIDSVNIGAHTSFMTMMVQGLIGVTKTTRIRTCNR